MFWFVLIRFKSSKNSLHRAFKWERGHKFWTDFEKILDFVFFPLGLSNFGWFAWFPFDKGQSNEHHSFWHLSEICESKFFSSIFLVLNQTILSRLNERKNEHNFVSAFPFQKPLCAHQQKFMKIVKMLVKNNPLLMGSCKVLLEVHGVNDMFVLETTSQHSLYYLWNMWELPERPEKFTSYLVIKELECIPNYITSNYIFVWFVTNWSELFSISSGKKHLLK